MLSKAVELVKMAKDRGSFVFISAEDVSRTETDFLLEYASTVTEAGADRLRLSDTVGVFTPERYAHIFRLVQSARYFHVTVNGIGERAGMPDIAQVAMLLKNLCHVELGLLFPKLTPLSRIVARHSRTALYPWHPIVGRNIFSHESGIHSNGSIRFGEPFPPELLQSTREIIIGKHSGKNALKHVLKI